ncbi:MAG: hypothetical protein WC783_02940 [Candidatus Paceibacterota bacterium]|jgi:hypothetical protein
MYHYKEPPQWRQELDRKIERMDLESRDMRMNNMRIEYYERELSLEEAREVRYALHRALSDKNMSFIAEDKWYAEKLLDAILKKNPEYNRYAWRDEWRKIDDEEYNRRYQSQMKMQEGSDYYGSTGEALTFFGIVLFLIVIGIASC